jgi:hypothetical protein
MSKRGLVTAAGSEALDRATAALADAEEERRAFANDTTARKVLGEDRWLEALTARARAEDGARAAMQEVLAAGPAKVPDVAAYDSLALEERKRVLASSIDAVFVARGHSRAPLSERVTILWRGTGPEDLPRPGIENGPVRSYAA